MPNLTFVLPHWLYWCGLLFFPLAAMLIIRRNKDREAEPQASLPLAYFLWLTGGFLGIHRFYLRSRLGFVYIPLFIAILLINVQAREARDELSLWKNEIVSAEFLIERANKNIASGKSGAQAQLEEAEALLVKATAGVEAAIHTAAVRDRAVKITAGLIALLLLIDFFLLPRLHKRCLAIDAEARRIEPVAYTPPVDEALKDPALGVRSPFTDFIDRINDLSGNFVAYWSAIAVFVYYYEVIARYVFNSPTNWAHEGMFLMFGMQYLLAGGYALREGAHVRVDVIYMHFSPRTKAAVDVATSVFFFIFAGTLLWSGWTFFMDSFNVREVSFTEWGIQYYPVKFAIPLGAALILLQGVAQICKDIVVLTRPEEVHGT